jgi:hypothetical protein
MMREGWKSEGMRRRRVTAKSDPEATQLTGHDDEA